jgi:hypothetical protein
MSAFNKFNSFVEAMGQKKHNLNADTLRVLLTNTAPVATNAVKTDLVEIAAGNGYSAGGTQSTGNVFTQSGGVAKLTSGDVTYTATGGSIAAFRYAVLYNDTATNDELIGWWDYGSSNSPAVGETFVVDFDGTNGILTNT